MLRTRHFIAKFVPGVVLTDNSLLFAKATIRLIPDLRYLRTIKKKATGMFPQQLSRASTLIWTILLFCVAVLPSFAQDSSAKISPALHHRIEQAPEDEFHGILVSLRDRVDVMALHQELTALRSSKAERVQRVVTALRQKAKQTHPALKEKIVRFGHYQAGSLDDLWIANGLFLEADATLITYLASLPEVRYIEWNAPIKLEKSSTTSALLEPGIAEPALRALNVHKLWELGYTGYGQKVLVIDSGVDHYHPALRTQAHYNVASRQRYTSGTMLGDFSDEHGTAVTGAILGLDRMNRDTLGPAFNAQYMDGPSSNLSNSSGNFEGSVRSAFSNLQWALNPDGNSFTSNDVPDVINNSWGIVNNYSQSDCTNSIYRDVIGSLNAAGVSVLFAAGNEGPDAGTINFPGALSLNRYVPLSVGATDENGTISSFSGRGPSQCGTGIEAIKPEVVAPGQRIRTTSLFGRYERISGTSFSTPYVTGIILLLREAFPYLDGQKIQEAIVETARDVGDTGVDNDYGHGVVDAFAAYNYLVNQGNAPVTPRLANNDVVLVDVAAGTIGCDRTATLTLTVANDGTTEIRNFVVVLRNGDTGDEISRMRWEGSLMPGSVTTIQPQALDAFLGAYTAQITLEDPNGAEDRRNLDNSLKIDINITDDPLLPVTNPAEAVACTGEQILLSADNENLGTIQWYDAPTEGNLISQDATFLSNAITEETVYYASLAFNDRVGLEDRSVGTNTFLTPEAGLLFDVHSSFLLASTRVYAEETGPRIVVLREPDGQTQQKIVNITQTGEQRIDLDFFLEPGEGYELVVTVGKALSITTTDVNYPISLNGVVTIRKSVGTVATFYPFFYDWEIEYEYPCGRIAVPITLSDGDAPDVAFGASASTIRSAQTIEFQSESAQAVQWAWDFGDGNTSTEQNPTHTYTQPGTYLVRLTVTNAEGCSNTAAAEITVDDVTSTRQQQRLAQQIQLIPNPVIDQLTIQYTFDQPWHLRIRLTDLTGRTIRQWDPGRQQAGQHIYNVAELPPGTYFLIIQAGPHRVGKKVIKTGRR